MAAEAEAKKKAEEEAKKARMRPAVRKPLGNTQPPPEPTLLPVPSPLEAFRIPTLPPVEPVQLLLLYLLVTGLNPKGDLSARLVAAEEVERRKMEGRTAAVKRIDEITETILQVCMLETALRVCM